MAVSVRVVFPNHPRWRPRGPGAAALQLNRAPRVSQNAKGHRAGLRDALLFFVVGLQESFGNGAALATSPRFAWGIRLSWLAIAHRADAGLASSGGTRPMVKIGPLIWGPGKDSLSAPGDNSQHIIAQFRLLAVVVNLILQGKGNESKSKS
jgi:hypothetical protein